MANLHEKVIAHHNQKVNEVLSVIEEWRHPSVVNGIDKEEWQRINNGLHSDIKSMVDYTNQFLSENGLPLVESPIKALGV